MVQEAAQRERAALTGRVGLVVQLAAPQVAEDPTSVADIGALPGVDEVLRVDASGEITGIADPSRAASLVSAAACTPPEGGGVGRSDLFLGPMATP